MTKETESSRQWENKNVVIPNKKLQGRDRMGLRAHCSRDSSVRGRGWQRETKLDSNFNY